VIVESEVECPGCGERVSLSVDTSAGADQRYYEDCAVCCRPMQVRLRCLPGELEAIEVAPG
jgi:hypothetical protein